MHDAIDLDMLPGQRVTPVTVLTGFLGAGKTTLLNRILTGDHGLRVAVLVNDFGAINIDADLVIGATDDQSVVSLANGCVCCTIREDLLGAVLEILSRPDPPEYIVLEASGVAEPAGIAATFLDANVRDRIRLDSILCVVDAAQVFATPEQMDLKLRQMAFADMLVLNKADLVSDAEMARLRSWLEDRFRRPRLVKAIRGSLPMAILLGAGRFEPAQLAVATHPAHHESGAHHEHAHHDSLFDTWSFETTRPIALAALRQAALALPSSIYRCKGVIHTAEAPARRSILQVVGRRVDLTLELPWGNRVPRTQIVVIGARGSVESDLLQSIFEGCIASASGV